MVISDSLLFSGLERARGPRTSARGAARWWAGPRGRVRWRSHSAHAGAAARPHAARARCSTRGRAGPSAAPPYSILQVVAHFVCGSLQSTGHGAAHEDEVPSSESAETHALLTVCATREPHDHTHNKPLTAAPSTKSLGYEAIRHDAARVSEALSRALRRLQVDWFGSSCSLRL